MTYLLLLLSIGLIAALILTLKKLQNQRYQTFIAEHELVESNKKIKTIQQKYNAFAEHEESLRQSDLRIRHLQEQLKFSQKQLDSLQVNSFAESKSEIDKTKADCEDINKSRQKEASLIQEANHEIEALRQEARYLKQKARKESEDIKKQAEQEIEGLRQEADREVKYLKQKAEREVENLRKKYKQKSEASKREIQQFRQNAKQDIEILRQEAELEVDLLREESDELRQTIKEKSEELNQLTNKLHEILENKIEEFQESGKGRRRKEGFNQSFRIEAQNMVMTDLIVDQENRVIFQSLEEDFYPQERREIIIATLRGSRENIRQNSRSQHIIDDIISNNICCDNGKAIKTEVQNLFRNYTRMNSRTRKSLESMGFEIVSEKNHYKIVFHGDNRYTISFAKTPSDWRTGRNIARDICNLLL
ncbi:hypothetical protein [Phormidium tenue]|uniref:Uncharacterized protein n=1 Tax=Phormidium tenue NIES-30 TaxID=549789 RepID=A0A1U7J586_9CYAN|nr:hypothetical protein [Phormidium tenue]MBD2232742.1 hypothetical protein [Phormidium tenue FACHB-1052]OKH47855.1 hypothetical protein NIES30_12900 [Phormidium tenue NIES-30]